MILSIMNFAFFLSMLVYHWYKKRKVDIGIYIIIIYLVSSFFSVVIMLNPERHGYTSDDVDLFSSLAYWVLLSLALYPALKFDSGSITNIVLGENKVWTYKYICWVLIALTTVSIVTSFDQIRDSVLENDFSTLYLMTGRARRTITYTRYANNAWTIITNTIPSFAPVFLLFFFYNMSFMPNEKALTICLFFSSLASTIISITAGSRTLLIYWFLSFGALWVIFRNCLPKKSKRVISILLMGIGIIGFLYFMAVTMGRFSDRDSGTTGSLINYIGQEYLQFSRVYKKYYFDGITWDRTFPIISKYILGHDFNLYAFRNEMGAKLETPVGVFFTYLGDAMLDFGKVGMFIYQIVLFFIEMKVFQRFQKEQIYLCDLIIILMLIRIPLLGLFAYVYKSVGDSIILLLCILVRSLLKDHKVRIVLRR